MARPKLTSMEVAELLLAFVEPTEEEDRFMDEFLARAESEEQEARFRREMYFIRIFAIEFAVLDVFGRGKIADEIVYSLKMLVQALVMQDTDVRSEMLTRERAYEAATRNLDWKKGFLIAFKFAGFCVDDETDREVAKVGSMEFKRLFSALPDFLKDSKKAGIQMPKKSLIPEP
jgi:hypothetical protein